MVRQGSHKAKAQGSNPSHSLLDSFSDFLAFARTCCFLSHSALHLWLQSLNGYSLKLSSDTRAGGVSSTQVCSKGDGAMKVISNQDLKNAVINLDDHSFVNCTLIGCTFIFSGRGFEIKNCKIVDCHARLRGEAARTIRLLKQLAMDPDTLEIEQTIGSSWVH